MKVSVVGVQTSRDHFVFDFTEENLLERIQEFADSNFSDEDIREKYFKGKGSSKYPDGDTRGWKLSEVRKKVRNDLAWDKGIVPCLYRPFDIQPLYYTEWMLDWSRSDVMHRMIAGENIGLITNRSIETGRGWEHVFCSNLIIQNHTLSLKEGNYLFPLYLHKQNEEASVLKLKNRKQTNISVDFMEDITRMLGYTPTPEAIFYYIYSIFHASTYRTRYAEFLKIDFPRIPLTSNNELFQRLSSYGEELVTSHLMKSPKLDNLITQYESRSNSVIDSGHPKYVDGKVVINKKGDGFTGVPEDVWNFYVGGYQVCHKWLKDRKGRTLSQEDIIHYQRIVVALQATIRLMQQIDEAIPGFPIT